MVNPIFLINLLKMTDRENNNGKTAGNSETKKSNPWWDEMDDRRKIAYAKKEIFSCFDDKEVKVFEKALKEFDKDKMSEMVRNGFDINQCDSQGNTLLTTYRRWCADNIGGQFHEDLKRDAFLRSIGAEVETEESRKIKLESREKLLNEEKQGYFDTLPPKGEINSIEDALKYEDMEALNNLVASGHNINACDEYGNTLLNQYISKGDGMRELWLYNTKKYDKEYHHIWRVVELLKKVGALTETEESHKIKDQIHKKTEEEREKRELNNSKLAKIRLRLAKKLGIKTELPKSIKKVEKTVSDKLLGKIYE